MRFTNGRPQATVSFFQQTVLHHKKSFLHCFTSAAVFQQAAAVFQQTVLYQNRFQKTALQGNGPQFVLTPCST